MWTRTPRFADSRPIKRRATQPIIAHSEVADMGPLLADMGPLLADTFLDPVLGVGLAATLPGPVLGPLPRSCILLRPRIRPALVLIGTLCIVRRRRWPAEATRAARKDWCW